MTSSAKREANRANARASTGPKTAAGKAASAHNARRHGLNLSALRDPAFAGEIAALAHAIAGRAASGRRFELACRIAAAQIDLVRVRRARQQLFSRIPHDADAAARLMVLDRYQRRALSRRKFAVRDFDAAGESERPILAKRTQRACVPDAMQRPRVSASRGPRMNSTKGSGASQSRDRHRLERSRVCGAAFGFASRCAGPGTHETGARRILAKRTQRSFWLNARFRHRLFWRNEANRAPPARDGPAFTPPAARTSAAS